jgi:hypothetical protein
VLEKWIVLTASLNIGSEHHAGTAVKIVRTSRLVTGSRLSILFTQDFQIGDDS